MTTSLANNVASTLPVLFLLVSGLAFNAFIAFCLWRLVKAFEEISASLAQIAYKTKDESRP